MWRNQNFYLLVVLLAVLLAIMAVFYPTLDRDAIYWAGGKNLIAYVGVQWLSLTLHLACVLAVYFFTLLAFRKPLVAVALCFLWSIHPMHTDTIAWVARQNTLVSSIFYLLSLSFYLVYVRRQGEQKQWLFYGISLALFGVAAYFQRYALIAPIAFSLLDFLEKRRFLQDSWIDKLPFLLLIVLSWYFGTHSSQVQLPNEVIPLFQKLWLGGYALSLYIAKFFVPISLTLINPFSVGLLSKFILLFGAFVILGILALFIVSLVRKKVLINEEFSFGLLFCIVHFLPSLAPPLDGNLVWVSYKAYLPYLGLFYALVGLYHFFVKQSKFVVSLALVLLLALPLGYLSWQRATLWKSSLALFTEVIEKYPKDALAYFLRGNVYMGKKTYDLAIKDLDKANLLQPDAITPFIMGHALYRLNDYKTSIKAYERATSMQSDLATTFRYSIDMAVNMASTNDKIKAEVLLKQAEKLATDNTLKVEYLLGCGLYYSALSQYELAVQNYKKAIEINSSAIEAYKNIGAIRIYQKRIEEAVAYLKRAEVIAPYDKAVLMNLANCYANKKDTLRADYYQNQYNWVIANEKKQ